jgi:zinc protease
MHEIAKLSRGRCACFYKRFYAPNNAHRSSRRRSRRGGEKLAEATYGKLKPNPRDAYCASARRSRPTARPRASELKDARAGNASVRPLLLRAEPAEGGPGEAEALYLLMKIVGQRQPPAASTRSSCRRKSSPPAPAAGTPAPGLDSGSIGVYAVRRKEVDLDKVEAGIDRVLHELRENPVSADELERAKKAFIADFIYESDSQSALAQRYARGIDPGMTIKQINDWPVAIAKVTAEDIKRVAANT